MCVSHAVRELTSRNKAEHGFSIVEITITLVLMAMLILAAAPSFSTWILDSRVRSTAESLQNDLRLTQGTAVARSRTSALALTRAAPAWDAAPAANAANWFARILPLPGSDETAGAQDLLASGMVASRYGVSITGPALLCFNSLGQLSGRSATETGMDIDCATPETDPTRASAYRIERQGASRSLEVRVTLGGRVRLCDASKVLSIDHPDGC